MRVGDRYYRTVWIEDGVDGLVRVIDQRASPFRFVVEDLTTAGMVAEAIREMDVRGAGCIGATVGYGMYPAMREAAEKADFEKALAERAAMLRATRPTAVNLDWAVSRQLAAIAAVERLEEKEGGASRGGVDRG